MGILRNDVVRDLHKLYDNENLHTRDDCEMYSIRLLDIISSLAHLHLQKKVKYDILEFLKYDFAVAKRVMAWFDENKLDEKYDDDDDTANIWSNLTKYYKKHPEITMADIEVLSTALGNFKSLETDIFAYGTLMDSLTREMVLGRQVSST